MLERETADFHTALFIQSRWEKTDWMNVHHVNISFFQQTLIHLILHHFTHEVLFSFHVAQLTTAVMSLLFEVWGNIQEKLSLTESNMFLLLLPMRFQPCVLAYCCSTECIFLVLLFCFLKPWPFTFQPWKLWWTSTLVNIQSSHSTKRLQPSSFVKPLLTYTINITLTSNERQ